MKNPLRTRITAIGIIAITYFIISIIYIIYDRYDIGKTRMLPGEGKLAIQASLAEVTGLAVDRSGKIYFSECLNDSIRVIDPKTHKNHVIIGKGKYRNFIKTTPTNVLNTVIHHPQGIAVTSDGNLLVSAQGDGVIALLEPQKKQVRIIAGMIEEGYSGDGGLAGKAQLNNPMDVVVDSHGNIYIADRDNNRIRKITPDHKIVTLAGGGSKKLSELLKLHELPATQIQLHHPNGITLDYKGRLYIADTESGCLLRVDLNTNKVQLLTSLRSTHPINAPFNSGKYLSVNRIIFKAPTGLAVDSKDHLFVADTVDDSVHRIDLKTGSVITMIDSIPYKKRDIIYDWQQRCPLRLAIDSQDNLYVTDPMSYRILRIPSGSKMMTTIAGNGKNGLVERKGIFGVITN